ncbi:nucleoside-diphosphate kinase [Sporanaerobium hydrogeniformans]|uniref:Nucleoside-diphosphate kinase n=1 Tax=Sporanaerobium hydrogeniformans TaxID=3072179 RepID=A0AC61D740_9FIRM|nr:nucleoside-diphosphate kinase [Sporanaerobium hydrogeniformans]PHV69207.1 nucleoside-diphosphate kinase [Sporanaerobium hydrogeniformans]
MERTFIMIKSDGVARGLIGEIIRRIERKGFKITKAELLSPTRELIEKHYEDHRGKPFFEELVAYILEGPVMAMEVQGEDVIAVMRSIMGDKDPLKAIPGTIRGDYANTVTRNLIHGSDSLEHAERELELWFNHKM